MASVLIREVVMGLTTSPILTLLERNFFLYDEKIGIAL